ncbi:hypothetical protein [Staphylococcus equorum]|uniref:hypothetical protein n=1 Tax=Staphylococcus equorum TaxID=246432 RepID=UPI003CEDBE95
MMDIDGIYDEDSAIKHFRESSKRYKEERDTLIDDVVWLTAKVKRAERENRALQTQVNIDRERIEKVRKYGRGLQLKSDGFFNKWLNENTTAQGLREQCKEYACDNSTYLILLKEISRHIGRDPSSNKYKYFRCKLDNLDITEDE